MLVTLPILALGTWLYLRRRTLSPRVRILLMAVLFLFVLVSGPALFVLWNYQGTTGDVLVTGQGGRNLLGFLPILWLIAVFGIGGQLIRLWHKKGDL
jgi:cytochrome b subunit of formate dehydrogenase